MKKLMILGAGIYQVPLIKTAKKMGIYTIAVSIPGKYPGFAIADKVYYENTVDYETVLKIAREENIDGILTAGTDVAVITIGKVCDELHLPGLSFEAAKAASNKLLMKEQYEANGVRTARFRRVLLSEEHPERLTAELKMPLIFKAVDTSGSRGIMRVDSVDMFAAARENVRSVTRKDYYIIEEFIEGEEFGAQAYILDHELQFILPHGDYVFQGDTGVPVGHYAPFDMDESILEDARVQLAGAAKAMGLNNCAINADFILSRDGKVYVLELGGRSGATCLAELVSIYYGYDYYQKMIEAALGGKPDFSSEKAVPNASKLLLSDKTGKIVKQENHYPDKEEYELQFDYIPGDSVRAFHVGPDRIGHVIARGETLEEAVNLLEEVISEIELVIE